MDSRLSPIMTRVAASAMWKPLILLRYGTVRLARGLTSMTYSSSRYTRYWMLTRPRVPSARASALETLDRVFAEVVGRADGDGVAGVDPRALDMLHYAGNQHPFAVGYDVALQLRTGQVLVYEYVCAVARGDYYVI